MYFVMDSSWNVAKYILLRQIKGKEITQVGKKLWFNYDVTEEGMQSLEKDPVGNVAILAGFAWRESYAAWVAILV